MTPNVALTGALRTLVEDPALRLRLGGHARHLVAEHFDAEKNARRLVELLVTAAVGSRR